MKNLLKSLFAVVFLAIGATQAKAQIYKTSLGLSVDFGDGSTLVGPAVKHFFDGNNAGQAEVVFGNHVTMLQAMYSYNKGISGAKGLNWYLGIGPALGFVKGGDTQFAIRPMAGLEYKINGAPIAFSFDWRPAFWLSNGGDSNVGRFGFGFKFTL
ncbi:hypothetical protein BAZ12_07405 [Elizabethkingia miricola]|jgi:hypothetical protein|uniref:Outer membrane insertion C-signal n=1 Tax=Elizabethkingia miricola TaxID=172045 RepID=A0AAP1BV40_ELIMR|nr:MULTISPECIES: hypothetical protein [Elizabethkingia]AJW64095.1 hypothetical protein VO54_02637 [Elizabethkingia miricola]KUY15768.1 hypothetical protein ATB95_16935 [Elizabethkingia miricola]MCL1652184.1 hypothetical protein [Elizabethkingia miricola]MCL1679729.1 hypothetical protein [Elizabethkingia miricola]MDQ8749284.1 hypothetical protein [Elizabethkingia miricola]